MGRQLEGMKRTATIRSRARGDEPEVRVWTASARRNLRHEVFVTAASSAEEERFLRCACSHCPVWLTEG